MLGDWSTNPCVNATGSSIALQTPINMVKSRHGKKDEKQIHKHQPCTDTFMRVAPFALITGFLPFLCIHLTYLIAASYGHVDWCIPYWDSCTSISATGRQLPEKLVFKFIMLPVGVVIMAFWWLADQWLIQSGRRTTPIMRYTGIIAALFLMLYVAALGEAGQTYGTVRRTGITLFFSLSFVAQLLFLSRCNAVNSAASTEQRTVVRWQRRSAVTLLLIGLTTVLLDMAYSRYDDIEDAFEWVMMLFVVGQFCSHYWLWQDTGLRLVCVNSTRIN